MNFGLLIVFLCVSTIILYSFCLIQELSEQRKKNKK